MSDDLDLLTRPEVCRLFGGVGRPIDPATLYRGIASGKFPAPVKVGPGMSRWLRCECEAALKRLIADRDAAPLNAA
jgi:predicted DNA-binding transcriptional regulator AlpA